MKDDEREGKGVLKRLTQYTCVCPFRFRADEMVKDLMKQMNLLTAAGYPSTPVRVHPYLSHAEKH